MTTRRGFISFLERSLTALALTLLLLSYQKMLSKTHNFSSPIGKSSFYVLKSIM
jgi:hypothetical protein